MKQFFVSWRENVMFPIVIAIMFGCIFRAIAQVVELFVTNNRQFDHLTYIAVIAALAAIYAYRTLRVHEIRGEDALRWRLLQLAFLYVLIRVGIYLSERGAGLPTTFSLLSFSLEVVFSYGAILLVWLAASNTAMAFERLYQPPDYDIEYIKTERVYVSPSTSLIRQFFMGGIIIIFFAGFERAGLINAALSASSFEEGVGRMFTMPQPVSGLVGSVFVYFLLGLLLLGQIQFATMRRLWEYKDIQISPSLANLWVRYSFIFLLVGTVIALLLPTRYSVPLFTLIQYLGTNGLTLLTYIMSIVFAIVTFPLLLLSWLLDYLFGSGEAPQGSGEIPTLNFPTPPPTLVQPEVATEMPGWVGLLQSLLFWTITLAIIAYVIRAYLRDNPEFLAALRSFRLVTMLISIWSALRRQFGVLVGLVNEAASSEVIQNLIHRVRDNRFVRPAQPENLSPKEQIRFYYLSLLSFARHQGQPRKQNQTPYEYQSTLEKDLPETKQDMADLTESFVEARYRPHEMEEMQAEEARRKWEAIQADLQKKDEEET